MWLTIILVISLYEILLYLYRSWVRRDPKQGDIVVITGGLNGLGKELSLLYSAKKCTVLILDIQDIDTTQQGYLRDNVEYYKCDISDQPNVEAVSKQILSKYGKINILINNAGVTAHRKLAQITKESFEKLLSINLMGHFYMTKSFLGHVDHVVTICSILSHIEHNEEFEYISSKHALHGLMSCIRLNCKKNKLPVLISQVYPYHITTEMFTNMDKNYSDYLIGQMTPQLAAKRTFEGICQQKEEIFLPSHAGIVVVLLNAIPSYIRDKLTLYVYGNLIK